MAISEVVDRKVKVLGYDASVVLGETIDIRAVNADTGDVGTRSAPNQGWFLLFYPLDFTGIDEVTVAGSDSGEDSGTVTV